MLQEDGRAGLVGAVKALRAAAHDAGFPLATQSAAAAVGAKDELVHQFDDYLIPRLESIDAPLLAVVGGSTGAGKSTLVNSLVGSPVSRSGVLRPTTTMPVLVFNPKDRAWFENDRILPGLTRVTGVDKTPATGATVRLEDWPTIPTGFALLDAPDIDSVVEANRELASQLLAAADLWLFVTTAARYADAVPWDVLARARDRGTSVAVVLDRVSEEDAVIVQPHLLEMLAENGLGDVAVFIVPDAELGDDGLLPDASFADLQDWLMTLARDAKARSVVVGRTLRGAMSTLAPRATTLVEATDEQLAAAADLRAARDAAFNEASETIDSGITDGTLLRGEVLARWQEFVGTGEVFRQIESTISRLRDRLSSAVRGRPMPETEIGEALQSGVAALLVAATETAGTDTVRAWRAQAAGRALIEANPDLARTDPRIQAAVERAVRSWQDQIMDLVRTEGGDKRTRARITAYGVNAVGLALMLVVFASTAGLTGAEIGIAGGTSVLAQRLLEAIFGDQAVRSMANRARLDLLAHAEEILSMELSRFDEALAITDGLGEQKSALEKATNDVETEVGALK